MHGTTHERPIDRLHTERAVLHAVPTSERLQPFLRDERTVGRDGYVQWEGTWHGLPWPWRLGQVAHIQATDTLVELWAHSSGRVWRRVAVVPNRSRAVSNSSMSRLSGSR